MATLVRKGLVVVDEANGNDRSRRLVLTQSGWQMMESDPLQGVVEVVAALPQHEKAALHNSLNFLLSRLCSD